MAQKANKRLFSVHAFLVETESCSSTHNTGDTLIAKTYQERVCDIMHPITKGKGK